MVFVKFFALLAATMAALAVARPTVPTVDASNKKWHCEDVEGVDEVNCNWIRDDLVDKANLKWHCEDVEPGVDGVNCNWIRDDLVDKANLKWHCEDVEPGVDGVNCNWVRDTSNLE
ncbi:hypothetical protein C8R45DRAFT_1073800 [Mycena sanguinolenta]|nr:hypothetical protein C8R45DRAFT_1073800 [Mycena sanguinolenta]